MKFELNNAQQFGQEGLRGWAFNNKKNFANASAAYLEVTGEHGKVKTTISDRVYFVIDGTGDFDLDGEIFTIGKTDVIIVPKNTPYNFKATSEILKLFLVHSPTFESGAEIKLE